MMRAKRNISAGELCRGNRRWLTSAARYEVGGGVVPPGIRAPVERRLHTHDSRRNDVAAEDADECLELDRGLQGEHHPGEETRQDHDPE
jgi:hypothetical protein